MNSLLEEYQNTKASDLRSYFIRLFILLSLVNTYLFDVRSKHLSSVSVMRLSLDPCQVIVWCNVGFSSLFINASGE